MPERCDPTATMGGSSALPVSASDTTTTSVPVGLFSSSSGRCAHPATAPNQDAISNARIKAPPPFHASPCASLFASQFLHAKAGECATANQRSGLGQDGEPQA